MIRGGEKARGNSFLAHDIVAMPAKPTEGDVCITLAFLF